LFVWFWQEFRLCPMVLVLFSFLFMIYVRVLQMVIQRVFVLSLRMIIQLQILEEIIFGYK